MNDEVRKKLDLAYKQLQGMQIPATVGNMSQMMGALKNIRDAYNLLGGEKQHEDNDQAGE